jgi:hypothetical protein
MIQYSLLGRSATLTDLNTTDLMYLNQLTWLIAREDYEVCPKSIRPWARKKEFCIWVVTIPNPLQSRPLVTPHT